jgi:hypothetical protein
VIIRLFGYSKSEFQKLCTADSITLATALAHETVFWTQNQDFQDMENVNHFPKNSP